MLSSSSISPSNNLCPQLPWNTKPRTPRSQTLSYSLATSYGHDFQGSHSSGSGDADGSPFVIRNSGEVSGGDVHGTQKGLPIVIHKSGKVSRYVWDGTQLHLVSLDEDSSNQLTFNNGFHRCYHFCALAVWDFFIPYKVQRNYLDYVKWKLLHRVFSSALQALATQAMFRAMGFGKSRSLASAAALNWGLKDGLGRLSRCICSASLTSAFDTNLKRVRFSTSVVFSLSIGVELLTPVFPRYFLLLAAVANIAKQISLVGYLATGSAIHRSFAKADNLGEISAKSQIQTACFDILGLMLAELLKKLCENDQRLQVVLPFVVYPFFSAMDLFGIYQALKHVHLQTLTKERLEIVLDTWIHLDYIPSPAEVSKAESIDFPWRKGRRQWSIRMGCADPKNLLPKFSMLAMCSLRSEDSYFICLETSIRGLARYGQVSNQYIHLGGILLCLREGATTVDIIMGLFQACHIRKALLLDRNKWEPVLEANDVSESVISEWFKLVEDSKFKLDEASKRCSQGGMKEEIQRSGWSVKNILLSTQEQVRYSVL